MRIGIDIDGVVSDSYPAWLRELNRHYGKNITVLEDYEMHLVFDVPWDDMNDFFVQNVNQLFSIPKPVPGARAGIQTLLEEGHDIIYITARRQNEKELTLKWMDKHQIPYQHVLFTEFESKVELVREWKIQTFIEDYLVNAKAIASLGIPVILLNTSYNQGETPKEIKRCADWLAIVEEINNLMEEARTRD